MRYIRTDTPCEQSVKRSLTHTRPTPAKTISRRMLEGLKKIQIRQNVFSRKLPNYIISQLKLFELKFQLF